jgi:hypothetical protein
MLDAGLDLTSLLADGAGVSPAPGDKECRRDARSTNRLHLYRTPSLSPPTCPQARSWFMLVPAMSGYNTTPIRRGGLGYER